MRKKGRGKTKEKAGDGPDAVPKRMRGGGEGTSAAEGEPRRKKRGMTERRRKEFPGVMRPCADRERSRGDLRLVCRG